MTLFGLNNRINVVRFEDGDDGAGGTIPGEKQTIYEKLRVRISRLDKDTDVQKDYGLEAGDYWQIVSHFAPDIHKNDYVNVYLIDKAPPPPIDFGFYAVVWVRGYQDEYNRNHHTSVIMKFVSTEAPNG